MLTTDDMRVLQQLPQLARHDGRADAFGGVSPVWRASDLVHSATSYCQIGGIGPVQSCAGGLDGARPQRGGNKAPGEAARAASRIIVGIDPGASTGFAVIGDGVLTNLLTISPWDIEIELSSAPIDRVIFEDSRLQSHTWTRAATRAAAAKMARNVGQVDAWCSLIVGICGRLGIPAHGISPKAKGKKLNAEQFKSATGWTEKSNQHERDAAMCAFPYRGVA